MRNPGLPIENLKNLNAIEMKSSFIETNMKNYFIINPKTNPIPQISHQKIYNKELGSPYSMYKELEIYFQRIILTAMNDS